MPTISRLILAVLLAVPGVSLGASTHYLDSISLDFNQDQGGYQIIYHLDSGIRLRSVPTFTVDSHRKIVKEIYEFTQELSTNKEITKDHIEKYFDYEAFVVRRQVTSHLIDEVVHRMAELYKPDWQTILKLRVMQAQL